MIIIGGITTIVITYIKIIIREILDLELGSNIIRKNMDIESITVIIREKIIKAHLTKIIEVQPVRARDQIVVLAVEA